VDLRHSDQDEQFRRELRSWLDANLPAEMRSAEFWRGRSDQERFDIRREWEAARPRPASPASPGRPSTAAAAARRP
jgi:hypothetical protein